MLALIYLQAVHNNGETMVGPECFRTFNKDVEKLIRLLTGDGALGDIIEYRGLRFYPLPRNSDHIAMDDFEDDYVCIHDDRVLLLIFIEDEIYINYDDTGDVSIESQKDLDRYLDEHVLNTASRS